MVEAAFAQFGYAWFSLTLGTMTDLQGSISLYPLGLQGCIDDVITY